MSNETPYKRIHFSNRKPNTARRQSTLNVKDKDGNTMLINAKDFDEKLHTEIDPPKAAASTSVDPPQDDPPQDPEPLTKETLKTLSVGELKELPQYEALDDEVKEAADSKGKIIKALLGN